MSDDNKTKEEPKASKEDSPSQKSTESSKETKENVNPEPTKDVKKGNPQKEEVLFDSIQTSQIGSLMPDSTEVVDIDDVLAYKEHFDSSDRSRLVPFIIYMDMQFRQVVKTKRRNAIIWLFAKVLFLCLVFAVAIYGSIQLLKLF